MRYIVWLEWEGFYAGNETTPLAVIRDRRVLDANLAARALGVHAHMDVPQLRALAPHCRQTEWRVDDYVPRQHAWLDTCARFTGIVEPIDQHIAAVDLTEHPNPFDITERLVRALLNHRFGTLRYGSAHTKWIACLEASHSPHLETCSARAEKNYETNSSPLPSKAPSAIRNPSTALPPFRLSALANLPVSDLLPVSPEHRVRLEFLGYRTIGEVAQIPLEVLQDQFGEAALTISQAANGGYFEPVRPLYPQGSLRELFFFESPVEDWQAVTAALAALADRIASRLEGLQSTNMELTIEYEDSEPETVSRRFTKPIHNRLSALAAMSLLLKDFPSRPGEEEGRGAVSPTHDSNEKNYETNSPIPQPKAALPSEATLPSPSRLISGLRATLTEIQPVQQRQNPLFDTRVRPAAESAVRYVRNTFGEQAIRLAGTLELPRRQQVLREWRRATGWH